MLTEFVVAVGNVDELLSAEFNFSGDPEAAKIVLEEMDTDVTLVPWEIVYLKGAEVNFLGCFLVIYGSSRKTFVKHEAEVDFDAHLKVDTPLASFLAVATRIGCCSFSISSYGCRRFSWHPLCALEGAQLGLIYLKMTS